MTNGKKKKAEAAGDELVKAQPSAIEEIPDYIEVGNTEGSEHITREDMRIPRLCLAQAQSPQLDKNDPVYIPDLEFGESFNDLTGENYGSDPLQIIVVRADPPRYVEFAPREMGGGVIDSNVPPGDPRTEFTTDDNGHRVKPKATKFYDYIVLVGEKLEPMAMSLKGSGLKTAAFLNGLIKSKNIPLYAQRYKLTPVFRSSDVGKWYVYSVKQASFATAEEYAKAKAAFNNWKEKPVEFDAGAPDTEEPAAEEM